MTYTGLYLNSLFYSIKNITSGFIITISIFKDEFVDPFLLMNTQWNTNYTFKYNLLIFYLSKYKWDSGVLVKKK